MTELLDQLGSAFNEMIEIERQVTLATLKEAQAAEKDKDILMAQAYFLALNRANNIFNSLLKLKDRELRGKGNEQME